jgi:hypothetical protein
MKLDDRAEMYEELRHIVAARKWKRRLIVAGIVCILVPVVFVVAWFGGRNQASQSAQDEIARLQAELDDVKKGMQPSIEIPVEPAEPQIDVNVLYSEILDIGELATVEYLFTDAAKYSQTMQYKDWDIPFTEKSFVLKWNGVIKAGVDLQAVKITVDQEKKRITVTLPRAKILSYEVDTDSIEVLDERDSIFNNLTIEDKKKFDIDTEQTMRQRAIDNGLLDKAWANAREIIKRLLLANPDIEGKYTIEFHTAE